MRAGYGFAFSLSNLKVSCFIGYVGTRMQVSLKGEKGRSCMKRNGRVEEDSDTSVHTGPCTVFQLRFLL